jgi:hypothetical protein
MTTDNRVLPVHNNTSVWKNLSYAAPIAVILFSMVAGYTNLHINLSLIGAANAHTVANLGELDKYDRFLQRQQEKNDRKLLVVETKQKVIQDNQVRLESKLDTILAKLDSLGTSITELKTINNNNTFANIN